jgi:hypothetical protein
MLGVSLCCQKAESVPTVNVLKVGEVQDQLGQLCCDVGLGSLEEGNGVERADEVLSDNNSIGIISHEGSIEVTSTALYQADRK